MHGELEVFKSIIIVLLYIDGTYQISIFALS